MVPRASQMRQRMSRHQERAGEIDRKDVMPAVLVQPLGRSAVGIGDAGIVDQPAQSAESGNHGRDGIRRGARIGHIADADDPAHTEAAPQRGQFGQRSRITIQGPDARALRQQVLDDAADDALRAAGHQHRAVVTIAVVHAWVPEPKRAPRASGPSAVTTATSKAMPATKIASTPA